MKQTTTQACEKNSNTNVTITPTRKNNIANTIGTTLSTQQEKVRPCEKSNNTNTTKGIRPHENNNNNMTKTSTQEKQQQYTWQKHQRKKSNNNNTKKSKNIQHTRHLPKTKKQQT
jgi:hypothetical protein